MRADSRKKVIFGFTVAGTVLALSSAAFACTIYQGRMVVSDANTAPSPPYPSPDPGKVTVVGNNSGMGYCNTATAMVGGHIEGQAQVPRTGGTVSVIVSPETSKCLKSGSNKLRNGTYFLRWYNGVGFTRLTEADTSNADLTPGSRKWVTDCMEGAAGSRIGNTSGYSVNNGSLTISSVAIPAGTANGPVDESAICLSDSTGLYGQQAPVSVF